MEVLIHQQFVLLLKLRSIVKDIQGIRHLSSIQPFSNLNLFLLILFRVSVRVAISMRLIDDLPISSSLKNSASTRLSVYKSFILIAKLSFQSVIVPIWVAPYKVEFNDWTATLNFWIKIKVHYWNHVTYLSLVRIL